MNRRDRKIGRIKWLMILSQTLIALFAIYWLPQRYSYEKAELRKSLQRDFELSELSMLDTLIRGRISHIRASDRENRKVVLINLKDSGSAQAVAGQMEQTRKATGQEQSSPEDNADLQGESTTPDSREAPGTKPQGMLPGRMLVEGIKVFMSTTGYSAPQTGSRVVLGNELDTAVLKESFGKALAHRQLHPLWIAEADSAKLTHDDIFFYSSMLGGKLGVLVSNHRLFLIKKTTPDILFGILLFLTTGAAFAVSYINLRKQLQLNRMRNEFVGNITHELKTPVATAKVALEALGRFNIKDNPDKSAEYISMAALELDRLDTLVQKVLSSSIHEGGSYPMSREPVDLRNILAEAIRAMQVRLDGGGATVTQEYRGPEFTVLADSVHLQGVIANLIDNSLKYTNENPSILIRLLSAESRVELSVSDNGTGIPAEFLPRVFEKFFRVPANNTHNIKGHGLGLNYVAMVAAQHGGSVAVKNNPHKGCTFTLTLPKHTAL